MKYLLFDEMKYPNFNVWNLYWICFCVFDDLDKLNSLFNDYIDLSLLWNDYIHFNKKYVHYTEDHFNVRSKFINSFLSKLSFKIYISLRQDIENVENLYDSEAIIRLIKPVLLKFKKFDLWQLTLIFESLDDSYYQKIVNECKSHHFKTSHSIFQKIDLYSWIPDYILWILKDFLIDCSNKDFKQWKNISWSEQNLDMIYDKISLCDINIWWSSIKFCASRNDYLSRKEFIKNSCKNDK